MLSGKLLTVSYNFSYPFVKSELEKEEPGKRYIFIKDIATAIVDHYEFLPDVSTEHVLKQLENR